MIDAYDSWVTNDSEDEDVCEHGRSRGCTICQLEAEEARAERQRENLQ